MRPNWIVCQDCAREHYALACALHARDLLSELVTDVWVPPESVFSHLPGSLGHRFRGRYTPELATARVSHFTASIVRFEATEALRRRRGSWDWLLRRNEMFQRYVIRSFLSRGSLRSTESGRPVVFAYAYAAYKIFAEARKAGATTVLGQIDRGLGEQKFMEAIWRKHASVPPSCPPDNYWNNWREECLLADTIVVNSPWSRDLLVGVGVPLHKIAVIPLIYERANKAGRSNRTYPPFFTKERPLRVLFLGSLSVRKGVLEALQAASDMQEAPVEFWFIGENPDRLGVLERSFSNVRRISAVPRSEVAAWYKKADVFLFPTHCDGFGRTQLEALDAGLPVIASKQCGPVIEHGRSGLILEEVSAPAIVAALSGVLSKPHALAAMARAGPEAVLRFSGGALISKYIELVSNERLAGV